MGGGEGGAGQGGTGRVAGTDDEKATTAKRQRPSARTATATGVEEEVRAAARPSPHATRTRWWRRPDVPTKPDARPSARGERRRRGCRQLNVPDRASGANIARYAPSLGAPPGYPDRTWPRHRRPSLRNARAPYGLPLPTSLARSATLAPRALWLASRGRRGITKKNCRLHEPNDQLLGRPITRPAATGLPLIRVFNFNRRSSGFFSVIPRTDTRVTYHSRLFHTTGRAPRASRPPSHPSTLLSSTG